MSQNRRDFLKLTSAGVVALGPERAGVPEPGRGLRPRLRQARRQGHRPRRHRVHRRQRRPEHRRAVQRRRLQEGSGRRWPSPRRRSRRSTTRSDCTRPGRPGRAAPGQRAVRRAGRRLSQSRASRTSARWTSGRRPRRTISSPKAGSARRSRGCTARRRSTSRPATRRRRWPWKAPRCACRRSPRWKTSNCKRRPPAAPTARTSAT